MAHFESDNAPLIMAMAEQCSKIIEAWKEPLSKQPESLHLTHLQWMCRKIALNAETWPATKVHRWIGFVQGGMIANGLLGLDDAKKMFDSAKKDYPGIEEDLFDHLNPNDYFELEIGGEG